MRTCKQCGTAKADDQFRVTTWQPTGPYRSKTCRPCEAANGITLPDAINPAPGPNGGPGGWVYVALMSSGYVKIGWTLNPAGRWESLSRRFGETIIPLAVLPGDRRLETYL